METCSHFYQTEASDCDQIIELDPSKSLDTQCKLIFEQCDLKRVNQRREQKKLRSKRASTGFEPIQPKLQPANRGPHLPSTQDEYICQLTDLLRSLPHDYEPGRYTHVDRAIVHIFYARGDYVQVQATISKIAPILPFAYHDEIEDLWSAASYRLYMREFNKTTLNSVQRLRVRMRNPCPTIRLHGPKRYKMTSAMRNTLEMSFQANPKPNREAKNQLAETTGLKRTTISNWFKNRRARMRNEMKPIGFQQPPMVTQSVEFEQKPLIYPSQTNYYHDNMYQVYPQFLETPILNFDQEFADLELCAEFF